MKKICLLFFAVALCLSSYAQYVDLGLPSGTKWKSANETGGNNGFYTYDEAIKAFGNKFPTKKQCKELIDKCKWEWQKDKKAYKVTGPNGNFIILPAAGFRLCDGYVDGVGDGGDYWSSTLGGSDYAWSLYFGSDGVSVGDGGYLCHGQSVRLVQK
jgi:hypothetical protein